VIGYFSVSAEPLRFHLVMIKMSFIVCSFNFWYKSPIIPLLKLDDPAAFLCFVLYLHYIVTNHCKK